MRGQASLEQIVLSAGLLALVTTVFVLAANYSADTTEISMAQDTVNQLTAAADFVYSLGPNSEEYVTIYMPKGMVGWSISGKAIIITMQTSAGLTDIMSYSNANLIGSLPSHSGTQKVRVEHLPSGVVRIGPGSLYCSPSFISKVFTAGETGSETITIGNIGEYDIVGLGASVSGGGGAFASIGDVAPSDILPGQNASVKLDYSVPGSAAAGIYGAVLNINSSGGDACYTQITISVNSQQTCMDQCIFTGYTNGTCRESASQCIVYGEDYRPEKDQTCGGTPAAPNCCCSPSGDREGPAARIESVAANNTEVSLDGMCNDTGNGNSYIASAQVQMDFGEWGQAYPIGGEFNSTSLLNVSGMFPGLNLSGGMHVVGLRCIDSSGNIGFPDYSYFEIDRSNETEIYSDCSIERFYAPIVEAIWQDPIPVYALQPLLIFANVNDTGRRALSNCSIEADLSGNWLQMSPVDGIYDQVSEAVFYNFTSGFSVGTHLISIHCTNYANITGPSSYYFFNVTERDTRGPLVLDIMHTPYPTTLVSIDLNATATDVYTGNSDIRSCSARVNSGQWFEINASDGEYDSPVEAISYELGKVGTGYYEVEYQCNDSEGNQGEIFTDSFSVVEVDMMLVMDKSGSMDWNVTNAYNSNTASASSTGWSWVKNLDVTQKNGNSSELLVEVRSSVSNCNTSYEARINGEPVASGSTVSTRYMIFRSELDVAPYEPPYTVSLYIKRNAFGCTSYNRLLSVQQPPSKMVAAKESGNIFLDISASNSTQAGLASYSTGANLNRQLAIMTPDNLQTIKNSLNAIVAGGSTCIECGLNYAVNELISARSRPSATRVVVLLTDGVSNVGDSIAGAVYARNNNVTVYTIGFGDDVDENELTNIALLTYGEYYYAPNAETLTEIFRNIGK